jgi:hypothetical protein
VNVKGIKLSGGRELKKTADSVKERNLIPKEGFS